MRVHVPWECETRLKAGMFCALATSLLTPPFHLPFTFNTPTSLPHSLGSFTPPHAHFTIIYVVSLFLLQLITLRGLDGTWCFESSNYHQFWSSSPLLTAELVLCLRHKLQRLQSFLHNSVESANNERSLYLLIRGRN